MVKIIVDGDKNRLKKYKRFECRDCGCIFIADNTEYQDCSTQRDGVMFQIKCPCCNKSVYNYSYETIENGGYR